LVAAASIRKSGYSANLKDWIYLRFSLLRGEHEALNRFAADKSVHNVRDIRSRDAPVKKVIGFD
jgi:hypothetical protein